MRLLSLNINKEITNHLEKNQLYICDKVDDISDAIYHSEVRYYNLVLIKHDNIMELKRVLKNINPRLTAPIIILENYTREKELELLKSGALTVLKGDVSNELILTKMEAIHRENFSNMFLFKQKYLIDKKENSIINKENNKKLTINGKPFSILEYLLKNRHRPAISKTELLDVLWEEPEWVVENVIEVNINIIRKNIQDTFKDNFINTVRHRGYQVI